MKINIESRFPHPVLSTNTGDYLSGEFGMDINVEESLQPTQVVLTCTVMLTEPTLHTAIADGSARVGLFVTCLDTYLSKLITIGISGGQITFNPGELIGRVTLRPMIWTRKAIPDYSLKNCHAEFGEGNITLAAGTLLAIADEVTIHVGREKLAQMDTIFSLVEAPDLVKGQLAVQLDSDKIRILVAPDIYQSLNDLRHHAIGKSIVLNSVYLPAVMQVLDTLRNDGEIYDGKRWYRVFAAKCEHLAIQPDSSDLWEDAQRLLDMPFTEIRASAAQLET